MPIGSNRLTCLGFNEIHRLRGVFLAALILTAGVPARAAVVPYLGLDEMTRQSAVVVLGTVEEVESGWSDDGRIIVTRATVTVERPIKGGPRAKVQVETPGGRVGDRILVASGAPVFTRGERLILFLDPAGDGGGPAAPGGERPFAVAGWNQGKLVVRRDPASGRDLVQPAAAGALYVDRQGQPVGPPAAGTGPIELGQFLRQVESYLAGSTRDPAGGGRP